MQGGAEERDGKLHFNGTVKSVDEKNQIWNALKTVPDWEKDVVADIKVSAPASQPAPTTGSGGAVPRPGTIADDQLHRAVGRHAQRASRRSFWATPTTTWTSSTPTATS